MHLVMTQAAEFRAGNLIISGGDGSEMHMDRQTGNGILFEAHRGNKKAVDDVVSAQDDFHFAIDWRVHRSAHDIVFGSRVRGVETDSALAARRWVYQFRLRRTKLAIGPGIAEVPRELHSGDLHLQGAGFRGTKTLGRPDRTAHQV